MTGHQRNLLFLLAITLLQLVCSPFAFSAEIKNVTITQLGNRVLLEFDVEGKEPEAEVGIVLTIEGRKYLSDSLHLEGDVGKVTPGTGKRVYWNVLRDFPRGFTGEIQWQLLSKEKLPENWHLYGKEKRKEFLAKEKRTESEKETVVLRDIQKTTPPVTFSHKSHSDRDDCRVCHHKEEHGKEMKCSACHKANMVKTGLWGGTPSLKDIYHSSCKGCHQKIKRGPTKCNECHKK